MQMAVAGRSECERHFASDASNRSSRGDNDAHIANVASPSLSIDRSGLFQVQPHSHSPTAGKEPETDMCKHLKALIQVPM